MRRLLVVCVLALGGCGGNEQAAPQPQGDTRLTVEVRPRGDEGPVRRRVVTDVPKGITASDFAPVPPATACAEVYGGPATARVEGRLKGKRIDATFDRRNACEMARWDGVEALLGPAPDGRSGLSG
jgi:hypothetical protein